MNLSNMYKLQRELDDFILKNNQLEMKDKERFNKTMLALLVEVGELANTTRCFKYWSKKGVMEKSIVLDELADVWHFYLSIGNQTRMSKDFFNRKRSKTLTEDFTDLYVSLGNIIKDHNNDLILFTNYSDIGDTLKSIAKKLGFKDEEVEEAYMIKHKENYDRQNEGY